MKENFILLILLVVLAALGYFWYFQWRQPSAAATADSEQFFGREFLTMAGKIKALDIDIDFFQSEAFLYLKDYTPVIEPAKLVGKNNPFLPITPLKPESNPKPNTP